MDRQQIEEGVRELVGAGSIPAAASLAIRGYGPEILGFLVAFHRRREDADEVFSIWCERLLRGLPAFAWGSSLRTWAYAIARHASNNFQRDRKLRERRSPPLPESTELGRVEQQVRSETAAYLRTEVKSKLTELRDALPEEDRLLLVLRLDKRLDWKDVARVMLGDEGEAAIGKEAQRLRKRFQIVKERLVEAGQRAGLLGGEG